MERRIKMKKYDFKNWLKCATARAIKTVAQTAVGLIGTSLTIADVSWEVVLSASLLAGVTSLLTSVAWLPEVKMVEGE